MPVRKIWSSYKKVNSADFVGEPGGLFLDDETGALRVSDGQTPGGPPLPTAFVGEINTDTSQVGDQVFSHTILFNTDMFSITEHESGVSLVELNPSLDLDTGGGGSSLTLNEIAADNTISNQLTGISTLSFDSDSLEVEDLGSGTVKISALGSGNLVFTDDGNTRRLTGFRESKNVSTVRSAAIQGNDFILTLATFTPVLSATALPGSTLNWDQPCTGFRVNVSNPDDIETQFISSVASITELSGTITEDINQYTAGSFSTTPDAGVNWIQDFTTNTDATIIPSATAGLSGGSASGRLVFNSETSEVESPYAGDTATWSVTWLTPNVGISMFNLSGNTFLESYSSTNYSVSTSGMSSSSNIQHSVSAIGGSVSNNNGSGIFTFDEPITPTNNSSRSVSVSTTFTRPSSVTGTEYTATDSATDTTISAVFSYPSFWLFKPSTNNTPSNNDIVSGAGFENDLNVLNNNQRTFSSFVDNPANSPQGFWFAVRSNATQPTAFKTGASASLLSDVAFVQDSVSIQPDSPPSGYVAVGYTLYGITLQPGETYVSIS